MFWPLTRVAQALFLGLAHVMISGHQVGKGLLQVLWFLLTVIAQKCPDFDVIKFGLSPSVCRSIYRLYTWWKYFITLTKRLLKFSSKCLQSNFCKQSPILSSQLLLNRHFVIPKVQFSSKLTSIKKQLAFNSHSAHGLATLYRFGCMSVPTVLHGVLCFSYVWRACCTPRTHI